MQRKQILMLSILAVGITIELILMAAFVGSGGNSKLALLSTISIDEAGRLGQEIGMAAGAEETPFYDDAYPIDPDAPITEDGMFDDMFDDLAEPDFSNEPTPVFDFGDGAPLGDGGFYDDGFSDEGFYPAPDTDYYDDDGYFDDFDAYPPPPTLPPAPTQKLPTDVLPGATPTATRTPRATRTTVPPTQSPAQATTQPAPQPTATRQGQPTAEATAAPTAGPTATQPPVAQITPTMALPTLANVSDNTLVSVRGDAPRLDGSAGDDVWKTAPSLRISTSGGANESATQVTVRSVYSGDDVYFLFTWTDPTESFLRAPWEMQKDGAWKQVTSPDRVLNDENRYAEDGISLLWPTRNMPDFTTRGCGTACHAGANSDVKAVGNMQAPDGGRGDLWQWKSVRNSGQVDDLYLDDDDYTSDNPYAGRHADPTDGGGYRSNINKEKDGPAYMPPDGGEKDGAPGYITESEKERLNAKLFKDGDRVPSILKAPFQGDRGHISAAWRYNDGRWTLEVRRKLVTGSSHDVQFEDLSAAYLFALATFDNTELRHAVQEGTSELRFQQ